MAGRKKRAPETAAPGLPETDASASVSVTTPVIHVEPKSAEAGDSATVVGVDPAAPGADTAVVLMVVNSGGRSFHEPLTRKTIPGGGKVRITQAQRSRVAANIAQINALAGFEALTIQEFKE